MKANQKRKKRWLVTLVVISALAIGGFGNYIYTLLRYNAVKNEKLTFDTYLIQNERKLFSSLTDSQLVDKVVKAIADKSLRQSIYQSIPLYQLNGLTYKEFQDFVSLLASITQVDINSFSPMKTSDRIAYVKSVSSISPEFETEAKTSTYFWLENSGNKTKSIRIPFIIQRSIQNEPYLSRTWMTKLVELYNFGEYYLHSLQQKNAQILAGFLVNPFLPKEYRDQIAYNQANQLLSFYKENVVNFKSDVELVSLGMDKLVYRIKYNSISKNRENEDKHVGGIENFEVKLKEKYLSIYNKNTGFQVNDYVPISLTDEDFKVYKQDQPLFSVGESVSTKDLEPTLGKLINVTELPLPKWINYGGKASLIYLEYDGLTIEMIGISRQMVEKEDKDGPNDLSNFIFKTEYVGIIRSATLFSANFRLGDGLYPQMGLPLLFEKFPFINVGNYTVGDGTREVYVSLSEKAVYSISVINRKVDRKEDE